MRKSKVRVLLIHQCSIQITLFFINHPIYVPSSKKMLLQATEGKLNHQPSIPRTTKEIQKSVLNSIQVYLYVKTSESNRKLSYYNINHILTQHKDAKILIFHHISYTKSSKIKKKNSSLIPDSPSASFSNLAPTSRLSSTPPALSS